MRKILLYIILISSMYLTVWAMPPYQGIKEPEALKAMRLKGMDSPKDGLIQQLLAKDPAAKISGSRSYPVVMGYFTDLDSTNTSAEFQTMLFSNATGVKSVNNYYRDMSYNAMSCSGSVAKWVTSGNTVAYFGNDSNGLTAGTTKNVYEFIRTVLTNSDAIVDFFKPEYDQNHDGYVDVLWVVHAGKGGEEGGTDPIWSHSWSLSYWPGGTYYTTGDISTYTGNPVRINEYIIMPERTNYADGNGGTTEMIGCGVFCHEFGHALGLPDLYDTGGYIISGEGLGNWSLMASGSWGGNGITNARPVALDVWARRFLGWAGPTLVPANSLYTINSIMTTATGSSYKLSKLGADTTRQYWLVENRYRNSVGPVSNVRWDSLLYSQGLAVYHIDSTYTSSTYFSNNIVNVNTTNGSSRNRPYGVSMEETDDTSSGYISEMWYGTNLGDIADTWTASTQTNFDSSGTAYPVTYYNGTTPTTGGVHAGVSIRQIPAASAAMACSMFVIPGGGSDFNIGIMQNPAFSQYLSLAAVSGNLMPSTPFLDTALMIVSAQTETLQFAKISDWTYVDEYQLKIGGVHQLHLAALDSSGTWRRGDRYFEVVAAKALGAMISLWSGSASLTLPPAAVTSDQYLAVYDNDINIPFGVCIAGPLQIGPSGLGLLKTSTLGFSYDPDKLEGLDEQRLGIYQLNGDSWQYLTGSLDMENHRLSAPINSLGLFAVIWDENNPVLSEELEERKSAIWPNPFVNKVNVKYQIALSGMVKINIYNVLGQKVKDVHSEFQNAGWHDFSWDGRNNKGQKTAPGVYYYRIVSGGSVQTGRMVLVR